MTAPEIKVLLVDDQELVRSGLRRILRRKDGFVIVAECGDGSEVPDSVAEHAPDVVLMDLRMKGIDGIQAIRDLQTGDRTPPVLVLTTFDDDELISGSLRAGAAGFILKDSPAEKLIRAVRTVAEGGACLDPAVTERVLTTYRAAPQTTTSDGRGIEDLTARELDVLTLIGRGRSNGEIGQELGISAVTVKSHVGHIFVKLDLRDRAAAIIHAFDHGIVTPGTTT